MQRTVPSSMRAFIAISASVILGALSTPASCQTFPSKPVRIVVPFPPGGSGDTLVRVVGQKMAESSGWGQTVLVENRPGANTIIGADLVAKSPPDGYTLFVPVDSTLTMNPFVYRKLPYNAETDFAAIALLAEQSLLLTVNPTKVKARTLAEFVSEVKQSPGRYNIGIGAIVAHVAAELLKSTTGMNLVVIPHKGGPDSLNSLLSGSIESAISDITPYVPHLREGRLRALAVTRARRSAALPDVPTVAEQGYPGFDVRSWFGLVAPRATSREVVMKINAEVNAALNHPDVRKRLLDVGLEPLPGTPEQFAAVIKGDTAKWSKVIQDAGIRIE
jgi:tripartite-type tricarboxylate transporter receptor subunit TctC